MYRNREEAGQLLADGLAGRGFEAAVILAIPRGGIVVAAPIAKKLNCRMDVLVTRKIGHPANPEVAIGAVMPDGSAVLDQAIIRMHAVSEEYLDRTIAAEYQELRRRIKLYTGADSPPEVTGRTVILVDDGIATGYTIRAALQWLKGQSPKRTVVAVPVAPPDSIREIGAAADEVLCPLQPFDFMAVGMHYRQFEQNTDEEVLAILAEVNKPSTMKL